MTKFFLEDIFRLPEKELDNILSKYNYKKSELKNYSLFRKRIEVISQFHYDHKFNPHDESITSNVKTLIFGENKQKLENATLEFFRLSLEDLSLREKSPFNIADFKNIKVNVKFLFHTALIYNNKTKEDWYEKHELTSAPYPEFNSYHTSYDHPMYFTITHLGNYANFDTIENYVFLRYQLKPNNILRLLDLRNKFDYNCFFHINTTDFFERFTLLEELGYDGYIGIEDYYELYLFHPEKFITSFKEIDFVESDLPLNEVNDESLKNLIIL